jgi:predicted metal-dependent hydrolase
MVDRRFTVIARRILNPALYKLEIGAGSVPLTFIRNARARRYVLRFHDGFVRVTVPRGGTLQYAHEFARKNSAWIEKQLKRAPVCWSDGAEILFRGNRFMLSVTPCDGGSQVTFADQRLFIPSGDDVRLAVEARMRTIATKELVARAWELARGHAMEVSSISVRNQRSRWGSCSVRKRISLNWRLVQTPEFVRDYIIIHELMHLKEMNHSPRFWKHVQAACPNFQDAECWLRKNSGLLR